jgi:hypothetical protein
VDVKGEAFACALQYRIRLGRDDLSSPAKLSALAKTRRMSPEEFWARFGYLVSLLS